jgi:hypothetical protein
MNSLLVLLLAMLLILLIAVFGTTTPPARAHHARAVNNWGRWLPVVAILGYFAAILLNLANLPLDVTLLKSVRLPFKSVELYFLFFLGALFVSRVANISALGALSFTILHSMLHGYSLYERSVFIFVTSQLIIIFLADKAPWAGPKPSPVACQMLRQIGLGVLTISAIAVTICGLAKINDFRTWLQSVAGMHTSRILITAMLTCMLIGWGAVWIRMLRPFMMPLLILPTLMLFTYLTGCSSSISAVILLVTLILSLTTSDRRSYGAVIDGQFSRKLF